MITRAVHTSTLPRPAVDGRDYLGVTVIVPAYNEAASIADTVRSLQAQTARPARIVVVDDCSADGTGDIARRLGVEVMTPPANTGSKAGAQNFALATVTTGYVMAVDGDTVLASDAIELVASAMAGDPNTAAVCGYVIPQRVRTLWERGRYVEYLYSFSFAKQVQDFYRRPLISSGCFSLYNTEILKSVGGWDTRTVTEDMDLTWTFYEQGRAVRFVPEAVSYPVEPATFHFMRTQLRRWSHGFWQNILLHRKALPRVPMLASVVAVVVWDAVIASLILTVVLPVLIVLVDPLFAVGYLIDLPFIAVPVLVEGIRRRETGTALASIPCFVVLRMLNVVMMQKAFVCEVVLRRSLGVYEKGH